MWPVNGIAFRHWVGRQPNQNTRRCNFKSVIFCVSGNGHFSGALPPLVDLKTQNGARAGQLSNARFIYRDDTMSIKVMTLVWDASAASGSDLLLLLAMADWANEDGKSIYPSVPTLARKVRLTSRSTQRSVKKLCALGELSVDRSAHRMRDGNWTNEYSINVELLSTRKQDGGDAHVTGVVTPTSPGVVTPTSPNPSGYPPVNPSGERPRDLLFDAVAEVTASNPKLLGSRIAKATNELKAIGATPDDVRKVALWFKTYDWRGRKGEKLTFEIMKEVWDRGVAGIKITPIKTGKTSMREQVPDSTPAQRVAANAKAQENISKRGGGDAAKERHERMRLAYEANLARNGGQQP